MLRLLYILSPWEGDDSGAAMYPIVVINFAHITADTTSYLAF